MWPIEAFVQTLDTQLHPGMLFRHREDWALCVQDLYKADQQAALLLQGSQVGAIYSLQGHLGPVMTLASGFTWRAMTDGIASDAESFQTACLCVTPSGPIVTGRGAHAHDSDPVVAFSLEGRAVPSPDFPILRHRLPLWAVHLCEASSFKSLGTLLEVDRRRPEQAAP